MNYIKKTALLLFTTALLKVNAQIAPVADLTNNQWSIWPDKQAEWWNDPLSTSVSNIQDIKVNIPTGGWESLYEAKVTTTLPATMEQFFWGENGNSFGVSGNYIGVSWFNTRFQVPSHYNGKRLVLKFESVRLRAEIFINHQLAGYDLINGTPFEVDITRYVKYDNNNELNVRITDPNGNFDWRDSKNFMWGDYRIIPSHGFGGITGTVKLEATNPVFIDDVFVKNKPEINSVDVQVSLKNAGINALAGNLKLDVLDLASNNIVYTVQNPISTNSKTETIVNTITLKNAQLWSPDHPHLYKIIATWNGNDNTSGLFNRRFGFRWFEIRDINGDRQFFLNGKRIVLRTAISWGFWPVNGITPSDELAKKQITIAKELGLNMLNFHRCIGQQNVLDYADELGLLYFEEPGGNQYPAEMFNPSTELGKKQAAFYFATRNERLARMIKRDRNHPSLIIYNLHNERGAQPQKEDSAQMLMAHQLDETRIITYNSSNGEPTFKPNPRFKLHLLPYSNKFYNYGWFDQHHAGGPGVYHDNLYVSPDNYLKNTNHKDEIIYWGEEGAIGTPPRVQLIRDEILKTGINIGWETDAYLQLYNVYDEFLTKQNFRKSFANVDSLTRRMGNVAFYYQGRAIENSRINNITDGYAINGWESMKLENHSGLVDDYRNPKGDVNLIARYNQPLYVAVKLNHKVCSTGDTVIADFFMVNEVNLKGNYKLNITATDNSGKTFYSVTFPVSITGDNVYGELIKAHVPVITPSLAGYIKIKAQLLNKKEVAAIGDDQIFTVKPDTTGISPNGMIADTTGILQNYFKSLGFENIKSFQKNEPEGKFLLVGAFEPPAVGNPLVTNILEWVNRGNTLLIVGNTDAWAKHLASKEVIDYRGSVELGKSWYGGNFFVKEHELFKGLPQSCEFNWEYQSFATYNKNRFGMRIFNGETVVGCISDHKPEVYSALSIIPHGLGKIIISTLDFTSCIKSIARSDKPEGDGENASMKTFNDSQKNKANIVGQQLLLNLLKSSFY